MGELRNFFRGLLGDDRSNRRRRRRRRPAEEPQDGDPKKAETRRLQRRLEDGAHEMSLRRLKRYGLQSVRVIDGNTIQSIVGDSIDEALRQRGVELTGTERAAVADFSSAQLRELMEENERLTAAASEADAERARHQSDRARLEGEVTNLRRELEVQVAELEEARQAAAPKRVVVQIDDASFEELEGRVQRTLERMVRDGEIVTPDGELDAETLQRELGKVVARTVTDVRNAHAEASQQASSEEIEMLEKRIRKLNEALEQREESLRKLAKMKSIDPGVASIYDDIQGLTFEDPNFERKSELLKEVFVQNLELQGKEVKAEDRDGLPEGPPPEVQDPEDLEVPEDFASPAELPAVEMDQKAF